jgi:hypothetical protein
MLGLLLNHFSTSTSCFSFSTIFPMWFIVFDIHVLFLHFCNFFHLLVPPYMSSCNYSSSHCSTSCSLKLVMFVVFVFLILKHDKFCDVCDFCHIHDHDCFCDVHDHCVQTHGVCYFYLCDHNGVNDFYPCYFDS